AIALGASFIARSFSGDKEHLVPLIKAGLRHRGFALIDIISPCVSFNDHEDSSMSYKYTYSHMHTAADLIEDKPEITADYPEGAVLPVTMHDGSVIYLRKTDPDYDPTDRARAFDYVMRHQEKGEILTGLLYIDESRADMHESNKTVAGALNTFDYDKLCPGSDALAQLQNRYR
ncbi:MAG: hypothetical protein RL477_1694, partial [Pseudomonadota bacterium]